MRSRRPRTGFTLVELLVVIAIIGVLVALLLPAVQATRESARRSQCSNQLKQIALGWQMHHDAHQFFPSAGWGFAWIGDPDRGAGKNQSGSWAYSLLPYLESASVHRLGAGATGAAKRNALTQLAQTPVAAFYCPSRRPVAAYSNPVGPGGLSYNFDLPQLLARTDYAANLGPRVTVGFGDPPTTGFQWFSGPNPSDADQGKEFRMETFDAFNKLQGVTYQRSEIELRHVTDGTSQTYLCGEKYVNPDYYDGGRVSDIAERDIGDDQGAWISDDLDNNRLTGPANYGDARPAPDQPGLQWFRAFGSAHPSGFYMAMCDGSVRSVSYDVDPVVHDALGTRNGGETVSASN